MKKILVNVMVCLAILTGGTGIAIAGIWWRIANRSAEAAVTEKHKTNIAVQILQVTNLEDRLLLTGSFEPWLDITVSAETMGKIEWQGLEEGDAVEAESEIIRIDTHTIEIRLEQARAKHTLSKLELARVDQMNADGISSPQQKDRALVDHDVTLANLKAEEIEFERSIIRARFTGIIDTLYMEAGEFVSPGTHLVRLVQTDKVKLLVGIPERDIPFFTKGDTVEVTLDALPGKIFEGTICHIATTAEGSTHTFVAKIALDNPEGHFKPGMIARASFVRRLFEDAIAIPLFSVITTESGRHVFVERDGTAYRKSIEVGFIKGSRVQVTQGLRAGERLVVVGQRDLRNEDAVLVREERQ